MTESNDNNSSKVEELKNKGNSAFSNGQFDQAIQWFTEAIQLDSNNHVLFSNRSACYASLKRYQDALQDANKCTELMPSWPKGWSRKAAAHQGLKQWQDAIKTWQKVMELDPTSSSGHQANMTQCFQAFLNEMQASSSSPSQTTSPKSPTRPEGDGTTSKDDAKKPAQKMEVEKELSEAEKLKSKGTEFYKKRQFDEALHCYQEASVLEPENVVYLLNQTAVLYEQERFDECIELCLKAVEVGVEHHADYGTMAKAYGRLGNAHQRLGHLEEAIKYYQKSLTENRTADIQAKLKEVEKLLAEQKRQQYRDPQVAEQERTRGNDLFKQGKFAEAVHSYTEAIQRDDQDPRTYANRAACYLKLGAIPEGLKDCESSLKLDPTFMKAHTRKCALLLLKQDYLGCMEAADLALTFKPEPTIVQELEGYKYKAMMHLQSSTASSSSASGEGEGADAAALKDPEVQAILMDPVMQQILGQMQREPQSLLEHLKNPMVANKIRKLISAGVIRTK